MKNVRRKAITLAVCLVLILATVWVVDTLRAGIAERTLAQNIQKETDLPVEPSVYIGGVLYGITDATKVIPNLHVSVSDVKIPKFGLVRADTTLSKVKLPKDAPSLTNFSTAHVTRLERTVGIDGVALGHIMGLNDLDIANPYNISPAGEIASEARLMATPEGFSKPVSVIANLRLVGTHFYLTPTKLLDGPEEQKDKIFAAFTYDFDTEELEMGAPADYVYLTGGMIYFQVQERNIDITMKDLSPLQNAE